jgi:wyosine [tRNA(Phe)-imidazoG37] synthetase (radical SAM superfamily)
MIVFGPVPSRRLGRSLGVNNIPPKHCSYSCIYCQLGVTHNLETKRTRFYDPSAVAAEVRAHVAQLREAGEPVDFITFVPDGEPTLDVNLGQEISGLKDLGIPIAVITNSSLLSMESIRDDLSQASLVSVKVDAVNETAFRRVDRAHHSLHLAQILAGITTFSAAFSGEIITETMLIGGMNDSDKELRDTAAFIAAIHPSKSYIGVPTRPPAEPWIKLSTEQALTMAYQIFHERIGAVEMLITPEEGSFITTDDLERDLLSIVSVHPMREEDLLKTLGARSGSFALIERLMRENRVTRTVYGGTTFYIRNLHQN